ncbi:1-deoxy-D-xylulose-5-phosphate reductoisomerase [Gordonia sp. OPL2]|nr:1-deoxy-D-xylulose-5-phosphate reductoisomerase [Gordonia sp. OPL2]RPA12565.1 1-deoxy-D-xylulose-5-phosphate reductoisomerase [Gordonia sp. OPL2]
MTTRVLILGSTGSIGVQALEVIAEHPDRFQVVGLGAGGGNLRRLREQAEAFRIGAEALAVADEAAARTLSDDLGASVLGGPDAMCDLIDAVDADVVLNAVVGSIGLRPSLAALRSGARLALANKESLVAGGSLVLDAAAPGQIVPVDSEHSAIAQCLRGGTADEVDRLVLTASGGPFRGWTAEALADVTPEQAGRHPTWSMGPMITLNSATLVNKALEVIEAHLLFGVDYDRIDVTVHPQSIVHSMVTFVDGATIAKASPPSMKLPIALALGWPDRVPGSSSACDFSTASSWTFEPVDHTVFPAIDVAREAGKAGGSLTAVYNAANEAAAEGFFAGAIRFPRIVEIIREVLVEADQWRGTPGTVEEVLAADQWARDHAARLVKTYADGVSQ